MRVIHLIICHILALTAVSSAGANRSQPLGSRNILPGSFVPPQVFQHTNLVRTIQLSKGFPKETVSLVVENIDKQPQSEYYLPFEQALLSRVGGLEVRDKKTEEQFRDVEVVEYDRDSATQYHRVRFPKPLAAGDKLTLSISWYTLSSLDPLPKEIEQTGKQYVQYVFSAYATSAYKTQKQKTSLKLGSSDIPDYTIVGVNVDNAQDPQKQGSQLTYGPYVDVAAGAQQSVSVRFEFTKPLLHATLLERDIEISHWGGNMATEERYWLTNRAATLKNHFSRVQWQQSNYYSPPSTAAKELTFPLTVGSLDPYYTDDIGNVSTSRFRSNLREANLELKPRYPVFGGWKYSFRIGWDASLKSFCRKTPTGDGYVVKVPFIQGPKQPEGLEYERVVLRFVLPEGATNVKYDTMAPIISSEISTHRTFMDTTGRTVLKLTSFNVVDDMRNRDVTVTYDYPFLAGFRKPLTIIASAMVVFTGAWLLSRVDVTIGQAKA